MPTDKIDFTAVKTDTLPQLRSLLPDLMPGGKFEGDNYVVCSPFRQDETPGSFKISLRSGMAKDFATGEKAFDIIELYSRLKSLSMVDAARELMQITGTLPPQSANPGPANLERAAGPMTLISPVPAITPPLPTERYLPIQGTAPLQFNHYPLTNIWTYRNTAGAVLGHVVRYQNTEKGKKETPQLTLWQSSGGKMKWCFKGLPKPRPLMYLDLIAARPDAVIVICEGEKKAEALNNLFTAAGRRLIIATSWIGGADGVRGADWLPLGGNSGNPPRRCILWPDNDEPGDRAMADVSAILSKLGCKLKLLTNPADKPKSWDAADAVYIDKWGITEIEVFLRTAKTIGKPAVMPESDSTAPLPDDHTDDNKFPFRIMGHDNGYHYFVPDESLQLKRISGANINRQTLRELAPEIVFERSFPSKKGPDWNAAADFFIRMSYKKGIFDPGQIRGRGAWYDEKRIIIHLGNHLLVNGKPTDLSKLKTNYIYNALPRLEIDTANPLKPVEAYRLREILEMLFWEKSINATFLAGWLAIAPICGALDTRPHIWLTGGKGTGKTAIIEHIINPVLGKFKQHFHGDVTEAGIRGRMGCDARPVVHDEAEAKGEHGQERISKILTLARCSSSESEDAAITKGTIDGGYQGIQAPVLHAFFIDYIRGRMERGRFPHSGFIIK